MSVPWLLTVLYFCVPCCLRNRSYAALSSVTKVWKWLGSGRKSSITFRESLQRENNKGCGLEMGGESFELKSSRRDMGVERVKRWRVERWGRVGCEVEGWL